MKKDIQELNNTICLCNVNFDVSNIFLVICEEEQHSQKISLRWQGRELFAEFLFGWT